uniref:Uncharacterized protein n=1 Tax=Acrobeloides nanus TaxID=290746 RepID=A0A914CM62_9BILA
MEECYISKPLDILDDPEFSTNELKEKIANLIYKLQFRMNKDSYANVEINFKFLRIQQCESTTPSYYPIYPYGYHELEDEDFRFYQYI